MSEEQHSHDDPADVAVWAEDGRLLVAGEPAAVDHFLDDFDAPKRLDISDLRSATDGLAALATVNSLARGGGRYVELSADSWRKFQQYGGQSAGNGYVHGFVRGAGGKFAGNMTMRKAPMAASKATSLQFTMAAAALRLAVQELQDAAESVAADVDDLRKLAEAAEIGNLAGLYRVLANARRQADESDVISQATWDAIASHEVTAQQGADRARALIRRTIRDLPQDKDAGDRSDAAERLVQERSLDRSLQLLLLAEQSRLLYRSLKLERVRSTEPDVLEAEVTASKQLLEENAAADRQLIDELHTALNQLGRTSGLDGLRLLARNRLPAATATLQQQVEQFAQLRGQQLEMWAPLNAPRTGDAFKEVAGRAQQGLIGARKQVGGLVEQLGQRMQGDWQRRDATEVEKDDES